MSERKEEALLHYFRDELKIKPCVCCFYEDSITTTKRKFFHSPFPLCFTRTGGQRIFMDTLKHEKDSQASWLFG